MPCTFTDATTHDATLEIWFDIASIRTYPSLHQLYAQVLADRTDIPIAPDRPQHRPASWAKIYGKTNAYCFTVTIPPDQLDHLAVYAMTAHVALRATAIPFLRVEAVWSRTTRYSVQE